MFSKWLVFLSTALCLVVMFYIVSRKNKSQLHYVFLAMMGSVLIWCIGAIGEVTEKNLYHFNPFIQACNYTGIALICTWLFLLGLVYEHTKIRLTWKYAFLFIPSVFTCVMTITNSYHHLFFKTFCIIVKYITLGPLMWLHYVYSYGFLFIGFVFMLRSSIRNSGRFSRQVLTIVGGASLGTFVNILVSFKIIEGGCFTTVPAMITFYLCIGLSILKFDMFNIIPIALQKVVDHISDGFILINEQLKIIDYNKTVNEQFNGLVMFKRTDELSAYVINPVLRSMVEKILSFVNKSETKGDTVLFEEKMSFLGEDRFFKIEVTPMFNKTKFLGTLILFKDVTEHIKEKQMIQDYQLMLESKLDQLTQDKQELLIKNAIMEKMAKTDALTDMYNHRTFQEYFDVLIRQVTMKDILQLAIFDIDDFKNVNDVFGHAVGDLVLKRVSSKIKTMVTAEDIPARYGGEEFAVIFTGKALQETVDLLELIRQAIENENYNEVDKKVTISVGVYEYKAGDSKQDVFNKADMALYEAKHTGKNRICVYKSGKVS